MNYLTVTLTALLMTSTAALAQTADMVFTNASVLTMDDANPKAEAVAVEGNKIIFVGSAADAQKHVGDATEVFDLSGRALLPGFVSGHDHIVSSNWTKPGLNLNPATSREDTLARIRAYVEENPDLPYVLGHGYNPSVMGGQPTAAELDEIVPDKVAIIIDFTIHDAWLNSKALEAGGITADTPDPVPGVTYWNRDDAGNPSGTGIELAWFPTYSKVVWNPDVMIEESRSVLQSEASRGGMTTVLVPGQVTPNFSNTDGMFSDLEASMKLLGDLVEKNELPIRTFMQPAYKDASTDPDAFTTRTAEFQDTYNGEMFGVRGMKIHPEGTWSAGGVLMLEDWADREGNGASATSPDRIKEILLAANPKGVDVFTHSEGSATVRGVVDAILASREAGNADERNAIHHYMIVHPDDHKRTVDNNIPVNVTPIFNTDWSGQDGDYLRMLGEARAMSHVGHYADIAAVGGKLSISADVPSSPIENSAGLWNVYTAMTHKDPFNPEDSKPFPPSSPTLTLQQGLEAITINPAWQMRLENKIGSIEVGKLADLVILGKNPHDISDPQELLEIKVHGTIMDGVFRHRDGM